MKVQREAVVLFSGFCTFLCFTFMPSFAFAEDADAIRAQAIEQLKKAQTAPRLITESARLFVKAAELYGKAGQEDKAVEMNSYLYWCKKR